MQVADENLPRAWSAHTPGSTAYKRKHEQLPTRENIEPDKSLKRKRGEPDPKAEIDPKLKEFLEVMQPASKSKTWANEDLSSFGQSATAAVQQAVAVAEAGESDDEYEAIPVKQRKSTSSQTEAAEVTATVVTEDVKMEGVGEEKEAGTIEEAEDAPGLVSDADWLRSKTSRLLDLTDDVDSHLARATASASIFAQQTAQKHSTAQKEWNGIDEPMGEGENAQPEVEQQEVGTTEEEAAIETISKSGRLFLRNLSYSTTEGDLREYFAEHGELEEVRLSSLSMIFLPLSCVCVMNILDRDILYPGK